MKVLQGRASQLGGRQARLKEGVMMIMVVVQRGLDKEPPHTKLQSLLHRYLYSISLRFKVHNFVHSNRKSPHRSRCNSSLTFLSMREPYLLPDH